MRVAVLVSSGTSGSVSPAMAAAVEAATTAAHDVLSAAGHEIELIDLTGFDPVMSRTERAAYFSEHPIIDPSVADHAATIRRCDGLLIVYASIASCTPPAVKGWLDRVLVPGVSFTIDDTGKVRGGLRHLDVLAGIAVHGESRRHVRHRRDLGRRVIMRALRSCARIGVRTAWVALYDAEHADLAAFTAQVDRRIRKVVRG